MLAIDLINHDLPALKPTDLVGRAIDLMHDNRVTQLVVTDNNEYLGLITEDRLMDFDEELSLKDILLDFTHIYSVGYQHLYEVLGLIIRHDLQVVAVLDENQKFVGSITANEVFKGFARMLGSYEPGAILELRLKNRDYSLTEISRLIEAENTKITSSYISGSMGAMDGSLKVTLKLNRQEISGIVATLERFGYIVEASYAHTPIESIDQERYDLLMKYLSI